MDSETRGTFDQTITNTIAYSTEQLNQAIAEKGEIIASINGISVQEIVEIGVNLIDKQELSGLEGNPTSSCVEEKQKVVKNEVDYVTGYKHSYGVLSDDKEMFELSETAPDFVNGQEFPQFSQTKAENEVKLSKTQNFLYVDSSDTIQKQYMVEPEVEAIRKIAQHDDREMLSLEGGQGHAGNCLKTNEKQYNDTVLKTGRGCVGQQGVTGKMFSGKSLGDIKQEIGGENEKCFKRNDKEKVSEKDNGSKKISYSRNAMEALRSLNIEEQLRMWNEAYIEMGHGVAQEYENMADGNPHKQRSKNIDKRQRSAKRKENVPNLSTTNKKENGSTLGDVCFYQTKEHSFKENGVGEDCSRKSNNFGEENLLDFACAGCANDESANYKMLENECDESIESESEDEFDNIQRPAFLVEGDPDFDSGPPQDGLEYLRRVRWEAAHEPKVKVAKLDESKLKSEQTVYMPTIPDIAKCPELLLPSKHWEEAFLADFSELRLALARLDDLSLPELKHVKVDEDDPKLSTVLRMDAVSRASSLRSRIRSLEAMDSVSRNECAWLYALCAAVDTPVDADTGASLRCLLRKCAQVRSQKVDCDDEVVMLNILVTISGKYFGQSEN